MKSILVQLDTDPQPSVFDRVVAVDAGVDQLFSHGGATPETVESLVHGAIFTRGIPDLLRKPRFSVCFPLVSHPARRGAEWFSYARRLLSIFSHRITRVALADPWVA